MKRFKFLLHPSAGDSGAVFLEVEDNSDDDEPLGEAGKSALDKERKARREVEKELKAANEKLRQYENQPKPSATMEERMAFLEKRNQELELKEKRTELVSKYSKEIEPGYKLDSARLNEELEDLYITAENAEAVISKVVKRNTVADNLLPDRLPESETYRSDGGGLREAPEIDLATAPSVRQVFASRD